MATFDMFDALNSFGVQENDHTQNKGTKSQRQELTLQNSRDNFLQRHSDATYTPPSNLSQSGGALLAENFMIPEKKQFQKNYLKNSSYNKLQFEKKPQKSALKNTSGMSFSTNKVQQQQSHSTLQQKSTFSNIGRSDTLSSLRSPSLEKQSPQKRLGSTVPTVSSIKNLHKKVNTRSNSVSRSERSNRSFASNNPYLDVAYDTQGLYKKLKTSKSQRRIDRTHSEGSSITNLSFIDKNDSSKPLELIEQKYLMQAFFRLSLDVKKYRVRYQKFKERCTEILLQSAHGQEIGTQISGYQWHYNTLSSLRNDLQHLLREGITEPYGNRIRRLLNTLDAKERELGWFATVQEAMHYFQEDFYFIAASCTAANAQEVLLQILDKNKLKYQQLVEKMVFEFKQGYELFNSIFQMVEAIKKWLISVQKFNELKDIFQKFSGYSNLKKTLKSARLHDNYVRLENALQVLLKDAYLSSYFQTSVQNLLAELHDLKDLYYRYYVNLRGDKIYEVAIEIYENIKDMQKALHFYEQNEKQNGQLQKIKQILQTTMQQSQSVHKKMVVTMRHTDDNQLDRLILKFGNTFVRLESYLDNILARINVNPRQVTTANQKKR